MRKHSPRASLGLHSSLLALAIGLAASAGAAQAQDTAAQATETTVKAELRRLMLEKVETPKGKFRTETFIVNVRNPQFPGGEVKLKDREKTM